MNTTLSATRRGFAEELRHTCRVQSEAVVDAFATVPREHFCGRGPWRLLSPLRTSDYWTTASADPAHLCHDVLVAIDESRRLNNGQPSLWACLYDELALTRDAHVVHVGTGTGYYSAVLAEIVGRDGRVTAVEIDPELAERTRRNLAAGWPQASVVTGDGFTHQPAAPADAIVVNAGVSHLSLAWLDALAPEGGRLLVPLTGPERSGAFLLITRNGDASWYDARFVSRTGIIACVGGRDQAAEARLAAALQGSYYTAVRSLRRAPDPPDETCWLQGDGWWFSTAPPG